MSEYNLPMNAGERQKAINGVDDLARGSERAFVEEAEANQDPLMIAVVGVKYLTLQRDLVEIRHALSGDNSEPIEVELGKFDPLGQPGLGEKLQLQVDANPDFYLMLRSASLNAVDLLLQLLDGPGSNIPEIRERMRNGNMRPRETTTILGLSLKVDSLSRLTVVVPGH